MTVTLMRGGGLRISRLQTGEEEGKEQPLIMIRKGKKLLGNYL